MNAGAERVGSWWYRPENQGRGNKQIAAQRWIAWLCESGQVTRCERAVLEVFAKHIDGKATTQKSIAFLAHRSGYGERAVQFALRRLAPSKKDDPDGWARRLVDRRYMHKRPDAPGRRPDNVPSWFTLQIPDEFLTPRRPPPPTPAPNRSPGGVEKITQAVIQGSERKKITDTLHPCSNLARARSSPQANSPSERPPERAAPPPHPPPAGGASPTVATCARFFPSYAGVMHRAVARLAALGWTDEAIVAYVRKASKDPDFDPGKAKHPLWAAVWRAEHSYRQPPKPPPPPAPPRPSPPALSRPVKPPLTPEERAALKRDVRALLESQKPPRRPQ